MMYKEFGFNRLKEAMMKQEDMKKMYGYKPSIFKLTNPNTNNSKFVVVEPKGLKRVG